MRFLTLVTLVSLSVLFVACKESSKAAVTPEEMNAYIEANPTLPDFDKACILNGTFKVGLKAETVRFLLGDPQEVSTVKEPWGMTTIWVYKTGGKKIFTIEDGGVVGIEID